MPSDQTTPVDLPKQFVQAGFEVKEVGSEPTTIEVKKYNCAQVFEWGANKAWVPAGPPCFVVRGLDCKLEDRGYQKFWYSNGRRFPIRKADLEALHRFQEEVRAVLGLKSLYNESLGTTSARSAYDRLQGRPEK